MASVLANPTSATQPSSQVLVTAPAATGEHGILSSQIGNNNYALVCLYEQGLTNDCQKNFGYYCTSSGRLATTKPQRDEGCDHCDCIDLDPKPNCLLGSSGQLYCARDLVSGVQDMIKPLSPSAEDARVAGWHPSVASHTVTMLAPLSSSSRVAEGIGIKHVVPQPPGSAALRLSAPRWAKELKNLFRLFVSSAKPMEGLEPPKKQPPSSMVTSLSLSMRSEPTNDVQARNTDVAKVYHNYALVCFGSRELTEACQLLRFQYYCNSKGKISHKGAYSNQGCDENCECVDLNPKPSNCLFGLSGQSYCASFKQNLADGQQQELEVKQLIDSLPHDIALPVQPAEVKDIKPRDTGYTQVAWDYALVCGYTRDLTAACQGGLYLYYCNSAGQVANLARQHIVCEKSCECINAYPKQACVIGLTWSFACTITGRKRELLASVEPNSITVTGKDKPEPPIKELTIPFHTSLKDLTSTKAGDVKALDVLDTDVHLLSHDYTLCCNDQHVARTCQDYKHRYYRASDGEMARKGPAEAVCDESCECQTLYPRQGCLVGSKGMAYCSGKGKRSILSPEGEVVWEGEVMDDEEPLAIEKISEEIPQTSVSVRLAVPAWPKKLVNMFMKPRGATRPAM
ncbi:hypothetical protein H2198_005425 [Neophaeococcomyces mojaviensis]|uniref:Uncharacterized protein n=1 Tax=Neophaeococcomyces mojaviensis TaxID=3383035 RepID=A0ACC3A5P7_9EURO|nr:hypothetical protein H2198_005425 [Knufia sp. JES_112]